MTDKPHMIRVQDPLWAASIEEASRRGESVSAAVRRFLAKQYVKGKG